MPFSVLDRIGGWLTVKLSMRFVMQRAAQATTANYNQAPTTA